MTAKFAIEFNEKEDGMYVTMQGDLRNATSAERKAIYLAKQLLDDLFKSLGKKTYERAYTEGDKNDR